MPFRLISRPDPALMTFLVTNAESLDYGQCLRFVSGRLTAAGPTDPVAAVAAHSVVGGTNQTCRVILVDPMQIWEADYTGTPAGGFVIGVNAVVLNTAGAPAGSRGGSFIDSATITGGPCSIIGINAANTTCQVTFRSRQLT